jgi:Cys-tRNA(Pro)/Cys-tRNA(Cys) deacylase
MKDALAIHRMLIERGTRHEIVRLSRTISTAEDLPAALGLAPRRCLTTKIHTGDHVRDRNRLAAVVSSVAGPLPDLAPVCRAIGVRALRPAPARLVNAVTEYAAELVCPLLLPRDVPVFIDGRVIGDLHFDEVVYTATGESRTALGIRTVDLYTLSRAEPIGPADALQAGRR